MSYGDNAKAALISRGTEEMVRVAISMEGSEKTIRGLSGMGDMIVTSTSKHSRNWKTGYLLGVEKSLPAILKELGMVAEGIKAVKAAKEISDVQYII